MYHNGRLVSVPRHDPIAEGTLRAILDQAGIDRKEFAKEL
jgi:hypothetical protein